MANEALVLTGRKIELFFERMKINPKKKLDNIFGKQRTFFFTTTFKIEERDLLSGVNNRKITQ